MHDPALPLFAAGALAGIAASLLARLIPDLIVILRHIAARRGAGRHRGTRLFLS